MKLARKLILALVVGIFAVMAFNAYLRLRSQEQFFKADSERDLRAAARALATGIEAVWRDDGARRAQRFVKDVNLLREEIDLRLLWIDELLADDAALGLSAAELATLSAGREVTIVRESANGPRRFMYWPLQFAGLRPAALELSESLGREQSFIRTSQVTILLTAFGVAVVCGLIAAAIGVWFVGRPMRLLSEKARRVGAGDLSGPLHLGQSDEIGELADEINAMCERLAVAQEQTARRDRGADPGDGAAAPRRPPAHRRPDGVRPGARARHAAQRGLRTRRPDQGRRPDAGRGGRERGRDRRARPLHGVDHPAAARLLPAHGPEARRRRT